MGDPSRAESQFEDALEASKSDSERDRLRRKIASSLAAQSKFASAAERLAPLLEGGGAAADAPTLELAAAIAAQRGRTAESLRFLERLAGKSSEDLGDACGVWTLLASLRLENGDEVGALAACRAAEQAECGLTNALATTWGLALFRTGEHMLAAEKFELATELDSSDLFSRYTLGVLYMDYLGDAELAREQFQRYLDDGGDDLRVKAWIRRLGG